KTLFFSNISHEFRTPLTLMLGPLQDLLAKGSTLSEEQREQTELLQRNALRLGRLVNTLLDFSRLEAGRMEAVYEPVDVAALTADLASSFRSAIEKADMTLVVRIRQGSHRCMSINRCGRKSCSICSPMRSNIPLRERLRSALRKKRRPWKCLSRIPASAFRKR